MGAICRTNATAWPHRRTGDHGLGYRDEWSILRKTRVLAPKICHCRRGSSKEWRHEPIGVAQSLSGNRDWSCIDKYNPLVNAFITVNGESTCHSAGDGCRGTARHVARSIAWRKRAARPGDGVRDRERRRSGVHDRGENAQKIPRTGALESTSARWPTRSDEALERSVGKRSNFTLGATRWSICPQGLFGRPSLLDPKTHEYHQCWKSKPPWSLRGWWTSSFALSNWTRHDLCFTSRCLQKPKVMALLANLRGLR